jgi:hypothetical protein
MDIKTLIQVDSPMPVGFPVKTWGPKHSSPADTTGYLWQSENHAGGLEDLQPEAHALQTGILNSLSDGACEKTAGHKRHIFMITLHQRVWDRDQSLRPQWHAAREQQFHIMLAINWQPVPITIVGGRNRTWIHPITSWAALGRPRLDQLSVHDLIPQPHHTTSQIVPAR